MSSRVLRGGGFYNAALAVAGINVPLPAGAAGFIIHVSAPCYVGMKDSATLLTFNTTNYGVIGPNHAEEFLVPGGVTSARNIHVAPVAGTAVVSIAFI